MDRIPPTQDPPAVWPPPPTTPARPPSMAPPPVAPRRALPADMIVYGLIWTLTAMFVFATALSIPAQDANFWPFCFFFGFIFLMIWTPLNVIWLACMFGFSLLHRAWLGRLESQDPSADNADRLRARSVRVGMGAGLLQVGIVCEVAASFHLPGAFDGQIAPASDGVRAATMDLLIYGTSAWLASLAAGWALGWLWVRRGMGSAART